MSVMDLIAKNGFPNMTRNASPPMHFFYCSTRVILVHSIYAALRKLGRTMSVMDLMAKNGVPNMAATSASAAASISLTCGTAVRFFPRDAPGKSSGKMP